jgi:general secretion pathway protein G
MLQRLRSTREEDGFTLIELLIVIVILGILAAIVVFAVGGITSKGNSAACKSDFKAVETAQEAYRAQNSSYASNVAALVSGNFLREAPSSSNGYTITTANTGVVTVTNTTVTPNTTSTDGSNCPT